MGEQPSYGQFCPVAKAAEVFCERWTPIILRDLAAGATRFSELRRGAPLASPTLLSRRLRQLEAEGVVERRPAARGSTYHLTPAGAEFAPMIEALAIWGQRWSRRELARHEIDLGLLIWAMQRSVHADAFGPHEGVRFVDAPEAGESRHLPRRIDARDIAVGPAERAERRDRLAGARR